jgi:hypothetical protein
VRCTGRVRSWLTVILMAAWLCLSAVLVPGGAWASSGDTGGCSDGAAKYWEDLGPWSGAHVPVPTEYPTAGNWGFAVTSEDTNALLCASDGYDFASDTINSSGTTTGDVDPYSQLPVAPGGELWAIGDAAAGAHDPEDDGSSPSPSPSPSPTSSPSPSPSPSGGGPAGTSSDPLYVTVTPDQWQPFLWMSGTALMIATAYFVFTFARRLRWVRR